jgi:hypothetical protein
MPVIKAAAEAARNQDVVAGHEIPKSRCIRLFIRADFNEQYEASYEFLSGSDLGIRSTHIRP